MGLVKVLLFILKNKIIHFGEIYRLISFHYFFTNQKIDIKNLSVLDIGFNKGVYRWYFVDFLGCNKYSGVEVDRKYLEIFPDTFHHNFEKDKLQSKYDLIFCSHVLEHVKDDLNFINNLIYSINDQDGKLLLRVPMPTNDNIYFRAYNSKLHDDEEHERDGYTQPELVTLLSNLGLKVKENFYNMGSLGLRMHTLFEILRDHQIRFQRIFQIPYMFLSIVEIYFIKNTPSSDILILAIKEPKNN